MQRPVTIARRRERDAEILLARVLMLPRSDQDRLHEDLTRALGRKLEGSTESERQLLVYKRAREAMRLAALRRGLPPGRAPGVSDYKAAAREGALPMSWSEIYKTFDGRWDTARRFYEDKPLLPAAELRGLKRELLNANRTDREPPLASVRLFLSATGIANPNEADYDAWAKTENRGPGQVKVVENAAAICEKLRLSWRYALDVAREEIGVEDGRERSLEEALLESGPLVDQRLVGWMLGLAIWSRETAHPGFPPPVAKLGKTRWVWRGSDILAYAHGTKKWRHRAGSLQYLYLDGIGLGADMELGRETIERRMRPAHAAGPDWRSLPAATWEKIPKPLGKTADRFYWLQSETDRWRMRHPTAVGPTHQARFRRRTRGAR